MQKREFNASSSADFALSQLNEMPPALTGDRLSREIRRNLGIGIPAAHHHLRPLGEV